jgi:hypothetical protein
MLQDGQSLIILTAAFRDRDAGTYNNRSRAPDDGLRQDRHPDRASRGMFSH